MDRSLTTTWSDPFAAFEEGRKLAPIEHLPHPRLVPCQASRRA